MDYANLIGLGIQFLSAFLQSSGSKLPAEIASSVGNVISQLEAHKNDVVTKAALESQRG